MKKSSPIITLLTDFGLEDGYSAAMKGVIYSISPETKIVDISHQIEPQNVAAAAFLLSAHFPFFPEKTVHVAVVDPGVGSQRKIILARAENQFFLAPDNGLLTPLTEFEDAEFFEVSEKAFWTPNVSHTFHGRDIFAPVAAHLATGTPAQELGRPVGTIVRLEKTKAERAGNVITGEIAYVDRFGNLVSSILATDCDFQITEVWFGESCLGSPVQAYAEKKYGEPLAIWGSFQRLEIAVNQGSAKAFFPDYKQRKVRLIIQN